ncbi:hypothetical protein [Bacillus chungangensis]|uniref:Uncharacterized protein n=1 Tax=Bacillus chungangensis TaxID=587633 RepID=A0ABT9WNS7_9BACI|nr:hypothetical protein [Bacillus chungangensis]MDQ0174860.1 hypothetical protein [Bacillus chungangensis]
MDSNHKYYSITSRLLEEELLNNEINQIIWEFALENLTTNTANIDLLENKSTELIGEWLKWKKIYDQTEKVEDKFILINKILSFFNKIINLSSKKDDYSFIFSWISRERKKSKLLALNKQVSVLDEIETFFYQLNNYNCII